MARSSLPPSREHRNQHEAGPSERPVLTDPRGALDKAERFAQWAEQTRDDHFESVIHGAYFAMFHAARAALLAVEGTASTKHGGVAAKLAHMSASPDLRAQARMLAKAHDLHASAHHGSEDVTEQGQALRGRMRPFITFCARLVDERAGV